MFDPQYLGIPEMQKVDFNRIHSTLRVLSKVVES